MKGIVFTEFVEFVEEKFGFDALDEIIEKSGVDGVYTQAGNYPFEEMVALLVALSAREEKELQELLEMYGFHLFGRLAKIYPYMNRFNSALDVVNQIDNIIHPEVHKLYPDAELPSFVTLESKEDFVSLEYHSKKSLQHLAKGLILGAGNYYNEVLEVSVIEENGTVRLEVNKH